MIRGLVETTLKALKGVLAHLRWRLGGGQPMPIVFTPCSSLFQILNRMEGQLPLTSSLPNPISVLL